jgi:hypothetical protein
MFLLNPVFDGGASHKQDAPKQTVDGMNGTPHDGSFAVSYMIPMHTIYLDMYVL